VADLEEAVGEGGACEASDEQGHSDESGSESGEGGGQPGAQVNASGTEVEARSYYAARGRYGLNSAESTLGVAPTLLDEVEAELGRESHRHRTISAAARFLSLLSIRGTREEAERWCRFCADFLRCRAGWLVDVRSPLSLTVPYHGTASHVLVFAASRDHLSHQVGRRPNEREPSVESRTCLFPDRLTSSLTSSCPSSKMKTVLNFRENSTSSCCADPSNPKSLTQSKFLIRLHGHTYCPCN
jgi:hypothetical protein